MSDDSYHKHHIEDPPLHLATAQARSLINELNRINDKEFPVQTRLVRDVLLCVVEHIYDELLKLYNQNLSNPLPKSTWLRVRDLGKLVQELYSYVRYLSASAPRQSPPAVQVALAQLTDLYFPSTHGARVSVVRPQWKYNLKCVQLTHQIKEKLPRWVLDPDRQLGMTKKEDILPKLWEKRIKKT